MMLSEHTRSPTSVLPHRPPGSSAPSQRPFCDCSQACQPWNHLQAFKKKMPDPTPDLELESAALCALGKLPSASTGCVARWEGH